ncbi:MAG: extracellular solute-binding protein [Clostridiales bacterium]|nr:extracellular solute-binding protein [Clostridiales bacterium]
MKRIFAFLLAFLLCTGLVGCKSGSSGSSSADPSGISSGTNGATASPSGLSAKSEGVLEHVWGGEEFPMPDDWSVQSSVTPYYDAETGILTCVGVRHVDYDDGQDHPYYESAIVVHTGKSAVATPLECRVEAGVFTADAFWYLRSVDEIGTHRYDLVRRNLADGEEEVRACEDYFGTTPRINNRLYADADGNVWIPSYGAVVCVAPDFRLLTSVVLGYTRPGLSALRADGTFFISVSTPGGYVLTGIDREQGRTGEELPENGHMDKIFFLDGYDYVYTASGGVYGAKLNEKKEIVSECLLDFVNSGMNADRVSLLRLLSSDLMIFGESDGEKSFPVLRRPEGSISLSDIKVLEVAFTHWLYEPAITQAIADFNRKHTDARIVLLDYSVYSKDYGDTTAQQKLTMDMVTGICSPDIVLGSVSNWDTQIEQILRKKLYRDLGPYLDTDPEVNRETVFRSVQEGFSDDEGKIWGLPKTFSITSICANRSVLDAYGMAGKSRWDLGELLDFIEGLPADVTAHERLTRDMAPYWLLGNYGLGAFFDEAENRCVFDSPDFVRYLNFLYALPKDENELNRVSALDAAKEAVQYDYFYNNKVALQHVWADGDFGFTRFEGQFGTKNWELIGFPTLNGEGSGLEVSAGRAMCVTIFCPEPDLAWEFVRSVILSKRTNGGMNQDTSILKERARKMLNTLTNYEIVQSFSGSTSMSTRKSDPPLTTADLREPGYIIDFTAEDTERIMKILDGDALRISHLVPEEVTEIVNEEISAFLAGRGSASDCAAKIQSRASIWLAEHH